MMVNEKLREIIDAMEAYEEKMNQVKNSLTELAKILEEIRTIAGGSHVHQY